MAVSMNTGMRSDFMIGDAAMSQRMAEFYEQQALFADILGNVGGGQGNAGGTSDILSDIQSALNDLQDEEKFQQALKALDREIGRESSSEGVTTNDGVFRSKKTGEDLPTDTKTLAKMIVKGEIDVKDVPEELLTEGLLDAIIALMLDLRLKGSIDEDETEELFNPAVAAVNEQNISREASAQMLSELYKIIEKHNEEQSEEEVTFLDGISEPIDENETLASVATAETHAEEESVEGVFEQIIDNMVEEAAQNEGTPIIQTQTDAVPKAGEQQNAAAQTVEANVEQAAQTVAASAQSDGAQMQFDAQDQSSESGEANDLSSVIESFTVKEAADSETTKEENAVSNTSSEITSRVKNASEELEMLKNAKLGKTESKPAETTTPLLSDQPIVFRRADGSEIEVKPTEIVDQTMRIIEQAIEENNAQSEYSLVLNPEELGRITVRLIKAADGAVSVTIAAENAHTQRILEQHSELMQNNLRNSGINLEHWQTVSESRQEAYAQDYSGSSKNPYYRNDDAQKNDEDNGDRTFADIIAAM